MIIVVTFGWIANLIASMALPGYKSDPSVHAVFGLIVGGAVKLLSKKDGDRDGTPD